jgi:glycine C-acetyltransferase
MRQYTVALRDFGPRSAGSSVLAGSTRLSLTLEKELGEHLMTEHVMLFSTGWTAGFGAIAGLVGESDYVVIDQLGHACLHRGAQAATPSVVRYAHRDVAAAKAAIA